MSKYLFFSVISIVLVFFLLQTTAFASSGINRTINFQGKLVKADGTNVADSTYTVVFSLYNVSSAGSSIWSETQSVTTKDGIFRVDLGSVTTFASANVDFNNDSLYLGIKVGADAEMTPRVRFDATPYALNAEKVSGLTVTNTTGTLTIPNSKTIQFADAFSTTGAFSINLTATATTNITLPSSGTLFSSSTAAAVGDILYASGSNSWSNLNRGSNGQCLKSNTTTILWGDCGAATSLAFNLLTAAAATNSIDNTNYAQTWNWSTLTTQTALSVTGGTAMTTGSVLALGSSSTNYVHTAAETGSLVSLILKDTSTASSGTTTTNGLNITLNDTAASTGGASIFNGINITPTINTTGSTGTKTLNGINIAAPTLSGCSGGACTYTGLKVDTTGSLANTTMYSATFTGGNVGIGTIAPTKGLLQVQNGGAIATPSTITGAGMYASSNIAQGSGSGKNYGVLGIVSSSADASGDKNYGGFFYATAASFQSAEIALHAETADSSSQTTLAEFVAGGANRFVINGAGQLSATLNTANGNDLNISYPSATATGGNTTGINVNLNTNVTANGYNFTGAAIALPVSGANPNQTYKGITLSGGAFSTDTTVASSTWTGIDINMPAITQGSGSTLTSTGLKITGGSVTSGTAYALTTTSSAGNVGIGTTAPGTLLDVNGTGHFNSFVGIGATQNSSYDLNIGSNGSLGSIYTASDIRLASGKSVYLTGSGRDLSFADSSATLTFTEHGSGTTFEQINYLGNMAIGSNVNVDNAKGLIVGISGLNGPNTISLSVESQSGLVSTSSQTQINVAGGTSANSYTVGNYYGLAIQNPTVGTGSSITNNYGLYIANQTSGSTNYGIYSAGGLNYFASNTGIGTSSPDIWSTSNSRILGVSTSTSNGATALDLSANGSGSALIDFGNSTIRRAEISAINGSNLVFYTNTSNSGTTLTEAWRITSAGVLQSNGAQTIQTSTGNLTITTAAGNGNIALSPNGTGALQITSGVTTGTGTSSALSLSASSVTSGNIINVVAPNPSANFTGNIVNVASANHSYMTLNNQDLTIGGHKNNISITGVNLVYVYDTAKDQDGGRWTDDERARSSSWYNETLSTSTRGTTKPFPKKAIIVSSSTAGGGTIYIYDAKDNSMWMRFNSNNAPYMMGDVSNVTGANSVTMHDGVLYVGRSQPLAGNDGFPRMIDFKQDRGFKFDGNGESMSSTNLANRNATTAWTLVNSTLTLSFAYNAGSYVDSKYINGKNYLIIYSGSGSTINIYNLTDNTKTTLAPDGGNGQWNVALTSQGKIYSVRSGSTPILSRGNINGTLEAQISNTFLDTNFGGGGNYLQSLTVTEGTSTIDGKSNTIYWNRSGGLSVIQEKQGDDTNGSIKHYTKDYITEELIGSIKDSHVFAGSGTLSANTTLPALDTDISVKANSWTTSGATNQPVHASGVRGTALSFDGTDDYMCTGTTGTCADDSDLSISGNISVGAWVYQTAAANGTVISDTNNDETTGYALDTLSTGAYRFCIDNNCATSATSAFRASGWVHLVGTYDGTTVKLYQDGRLIASTSYSGGLTDTNSTTFIGARANTGTPDQFFTGRVDEPFVTANAITLAQIRHMYQVGYLATQNHTSDTLQQLNGSSNNVNGVAVDLNKGLLYVGTSGGGVSVLGIDSDTRLSTYASSSPTDDTGTGFANDTSGALSIGRGFGTGSIIALSYTNGAWLESNDTSFKDFLASSYNPFGLGLTQSNLNVDKIFQVVNQASSRLDNFSEGSAQDPQLYQAFAIDTNGNINWNANATTSNSASWNFANTTANAIGITANSTTTGHVLDLTATGLTTGSGIYLTGGTAMTTGSAAVLGTSATNYVHTAAETGSLVSLSLKDTSTASSGTTTTNGLSLALNDTAANTGGSSVFNGINLTPTINTTGSTGTKILNGINIAAPTLTGCSGGACTYTGLKVDTTGSLANTTLYSAAFIGGNVGVGLSSPSNARLEVLATSGDQSRFEYDSSDYSKIAVTSTGATTISTAGSAPNLTLSTGAANANISLSPNGSGSVGLNTATTVVGTGDGGTPITATIRGAAAAGSNVAGANLLFDASNGTGTGGSGSFIFRTAPTDSTLTASYDSQNNVLGSGSSTATYNLTVGNNTNRLIVVTVHIWTGTGTTVSGITYAGVSFNSANKVVANQGTARTEIWWMTAPTTGSNNVVVTLSNSPDSWVTGASSWYNIDQTTPINASNTATAGSGSTATVTVTGGNTGSKLVDAVSALCSTLTPNAAQTTIWTRTPCNIEGGSSYQAGGSSVSSTWTIGGSQWALAAVSLAPLSSSTPNVLAERLRITNTGNIGIGLASPNFPLEVYKDSNVPQISASGTSTSKIAGYNLRIDSTNLWQLITDNADSNKFFIQYNGSSSNRFLTVNSSGNIGIGNTSPNSPLDISQSISATGANNTVNIASTFSGNSLTGVQSLVNANMTVSGTGSTDIRAGNFRLTHSGTGTAANALGLLGRLTNSSTGTITTAYGIESLLENTGGGTLTTAYGVQSGLTNSSGTVTNYYGFYAAAPTGAGTTTNKYAFVSEANAGNVGIGTITPSAKLDLKDGNFVLTDTDVSHSMTSVLPASAFAQFSPTSGTLGGLTVEGASVNTGGAGQNPLLLAGEFGNNNPTDTVAAVEIRGRKYNNGSSVTALASTETVLQILNASTPLMTALGNGNVGIGITVPNFRTSILDSQASTNIASVTNSNTTDSTSTSVLRLNLGTATSGTSSRFIQFYAGSTTDNDGTGVGRIRLNNTGVAYETGGADFAEYFPVTEKVEAGDVISIKSDGNAKAVSGEKLLGVVSDTAGFIGNAKGDKPESNEAVIGLSGQILIKVSTENGPISVGDYLTASSVPGVAMKATNPGAVIGKALENYDNQGNGKILSFVQPSYADPNNMLANFKLDSQGNIALSQYSYPDGKTQLNQDELIQKYVFQTPSVNQSQLKELYADRIVAGLEIATPTVLTKTLEAQTIKAIAENTITFQMDADGKVIFGSKDNPAITFDAQGNATFKGTITAGSIKADQIEGLTLLTNKLIAGTISARESTSSAQQQSMLNSNVLGLAIHSGGLTVDGPAEFKGNTIFDSIVEFFSNVIFHGDITFLGRTTFNADTGGLATIKKGQDYVEIKFTKDYQIAPVVSANVILDETASLDQDTQIKNLLAENIHYVITKRSIHGFTIQLKDPATADISFNWTAIAIKDPLTATNPNLPDNYPLQSQLPLSSPVASSDATLNQ